MNYVQNELAKVQDNKADTSEENLNELSDSQLLLVGGGIADPILA